jgi:DNA polymerase III delta prime subunit
MTASSLAVKSIVELAGRGRLPQSLLLYGVHLPTVQAAARDLLIALFCPASCGSCADCSGILSCTHPEVFTLPAGETVRIDTVRDALVHLDVHAAVRAGGKRSWRVIWLEEAENLTEQAANALLKTVEEPPPGAFIVVTARHPRNLLPTLRSRLLAMRIPCVTEPPSLPAEMLDAVGELFAAKSMAAALVPAERLARQGRIKAGEFSELAEIALRGIYQKALASNDENAKAALTAAAGSRRELLSRLHRFARRRNLALNTQLAAELSASFLD